jgi:hypothetical protein
LYNVSPSDICSSGAAREVRSKSRAEAEYHK